MHTRLHESAAVEQGGPQRQMGEHEERGVVLALRQEQEFFRQRQCHLQLRPHGMKRLQASQRHEELQSVSHTSAQVPGSGIRLCHVRRCITPGGDQRRAEGGLQDQLLLGALGVSGKVVSNSNPLVRSWMAS